MKKRHFLALGGSALLSGLTPHTTFAQSKFPERPIRIIVPFAPAGDGDIIGRLWVKYAITHTGANFVVDNRAGAGGAIGAAEVSRARPDGYTLLLGTSSTQIINPLASGTTSYDAIKDFTPIGMIGGTPNMLVVNAALPVNNVKEFIAYLKKNPGKYSYASSGTGGIGHLQTELWKSLAGVFITHIPYRGAGPALNDTVAGQVPIIFDNLPSALPFIQAGKLVPIVVAAPQRLPQLPNVPTFKEIGLEPVNRMAYYGILGPKNLPKDVIDKISNGVKKALQDPAVSKRIQDTGSLVVANSPEEFAAQIKAEFEVYKKVVDQQKLKLD